MKTQFRILALLTVALSGLLAFAGPVQAFPQSTNPAPATPATPSTSNPTAKEAKEAAAAALPSVDDLRAPTSPAFVLLGIEPTTIERPTTPKAFVASLLSAIQKNNGLPQDYAVSIAPYWLTNHPALKSSELFGTGLSVTTFLHTLSLSIASTRPDNQNAAGGAAAEAKEGGQNSVGLLDQPALGIGFRGLLVGGRTTERFRKESKQLSILVNSTLDCIVQEEEHLPPSPECQVPEETRLDNIRELSKEISNLTVQRVGFTLELAGGAAWVFPDGKFDQKELQRWGVWLTPAYRWDNTEGQPRWDILGVARYLREERGTKGDTFDFGGRLIWHPNGQTALSAEYVRRVRDNSNSEDTNRLVAVLEHQVGDNMYLFASYGEDFAEGADDKPLVSTFGIKFGLGQTPRISPD